MEKTDRITYIVDEIFNLYILRGHDDYIGEPVSQLEHMWQAAALAQAEGYEEEVVLAAFFHDIGHLCAADQQNMGGYGAADHENAGALYLKERGFSDRLAKLVKSHVSAKRYLTFKFPHYYQQLSEASRATLVFQGGVMEPAEAAFFEADVDFELMLRFRQWDDQAKEPNIPVLSLDQLKAMAIRHLSIGKI